MLVDGYMDCFSVFLYNKTSLFLSVFAIFREEFKAEVGAGPGPGPRPGPVAGPMAGPVASIKAEADPDPGAASEAMISVISKGVGMDLGLLEG